MNHLHGLPGHLLSADFGRLEEKRLSRPCPSHGKFRRLHSDQTPRTGAKHFPLDLCAFDM